MPCCQIISIERVDDPCPVVNPIPSQRNRYPLCEQFFISTNNCLLGINYDYNVTIFSTTLYAWLPEKQLLPVCMTALNFIILSMPGFQKSNYSLF